MLSKMCFDKKKPESGLIVALIPRERERKIALYRVGWLNMLEVSL